MREFLGSRASVPYIEPWMGRVDSMKRLQGWTDTTVTHFRDLGVFGERLLLSIRLANWMSFSDQQIARTWVRYWKPEIQGYIHAYQAATGVDLTLDATNESQAAAKYMLPSILLRQRLLEQQGAAALPAGTAGFGDQQLFTRAVQSRPVGARAVRRLPGS
jgi:hypothetical protein